MVLFLGMIDSDDNDRVMQDGGHHSVLLLALAPPETVSFVSLRPSMFPSASPRGTLKSRGNSLFPEGPVIKCFVIPPDSKIEKKLQKNE